MFVSLYCPVLYHYVLYKNHTWAERTEHWMDEDFVVIKIIMRNAFHLVSCQVLLDECSAYFPELLHWGSVVLWAASCLVASNGYHQVGVQQGNPLGPRPCSSTLCCTNWLLPLLRMMYVPVCCSTNGTLMMVQLQGLSLL